MISNEQKQLIAYYSEGLKLYKQRQWEEAIVQFKKALEITPDDGPSKLYIERCNEYKQSPPPEDWDGVFVMKTK
jgi:tetratricopeptide (TPR) repeat protein